MREPVEAADAGEQPGVERRQIIAVKFQIYEGW